MIRSLYPFVRWCYSIPFLVGSSLLAVFALLLLVVRFDEVAARSPELSAFMSPTNVMVLAAVLAGTKLIHELAHAVTCHHFGAECHEMGLLLLVFTPCPYCDVTDGWSLSNRRHRIAISAAGMFAETLIAAIASLVWWFTLPGLTSLVLFNVMVVCSVATFLVIANPLLRYDGYFILSDMADWPNLWQESRQRIRATLGWCLTGFSEPGPKSTRTRSLFLHTYATLSIAYRTLIVLSILSLIYQALVRFHMHRIAVLVLAVVTILFLVEPMFRILRTIRSPSTRRLMLRPRGMVGLFVACCLICGFIYLPVPTHVRAPLLMRIQDTRQVFVSVPGMLVQCVRAGATVRRGDVIAELENDELESELTKLRSKIRQQEGRLQSLQAMRAEPASVGIAASSCGGNAGRFSASACPVNEDQSALKLLSPVDGVVIAAPSVREKSTDSIQLASWSGRPTDVENMGSQLERQTLFCLVGQPGKQEAVLYVDQSEISYLKKGQSVRLSIDTHPGRILFGRVSQISEVDTDSVPHELAAQNRVPSLESEDGSPVSALPTYQVSVELTDCDATFFVASRGSAKIAVEWLPLGRQVFRWVSSVFTARS